MKLTLKQKRFADEYIISGNIEQAAIKAGYSKKYARGRSHELLANVGIKNYIEEQLKKLEDEKIAKQEEVMKYLTAVMRGEVKEEVVVVCGDGDGYSSPRHVKKELTPKDRLKAAELLGKRYAMFTDKQEVTQDVNVNIQFEGVDRDESE